MLVFRAFFENSFCTKTESKLSGKKKDVFIEYCATAGSMGTGSQVASADVI